MSDLRSDDAETLDVEGSAVGLTAPSVGERLDRYVVLEEIGRGGMGRVLRAYDPKLHREVALKVLRTDRFSEDGQARMVREARAMAQLSHPNVVAIYDVELRVPGSVVLAMEFVEGATLRAWLLETPRTMREILEVFIEAGRGLKAAHDQGLLHRDFKPTNVLLGRDGRCRVTDFGLARPTDQATTGERSDPHPSGDGDLGASYDSLSAPVTGFGQVLGTPPYMAPEQHTGKALTPAADQYAFCVALWEALVGTRPFAGELTEMAKAKLAGPPVFPRDADVPSSVAAVVVRGLRPDPVERWPSMAALLGELARAAVPRRRTRWIGAAMTLAIAGAGVAVAADQAQAPCSGARDRLGDAWSDARRGQVQAALQAGAPAYAGTVWDSLSRELDGYADAWVIQHEDACNATAVRGEQSEAALDLRMACLDDARRSLDAATTVLATADASVSRRTYQIVETLPDLARCRDLAMLGTEVAAPSAQEADAVAEVRDILAQGGALRAAGKYDEYAQAVVKASALADTLTYPPLRAEQLHAQGFMHVTKGEYDDAARILADALEHALAGGMQERSRDIAIDLVDTTGRRQSRLEAALAYGDTALGLLGRRPSARAEARLRTALGEVYTATADYDDAVEQLQAAIDLLTELHGPDDPRLTNTYTAMASVMQQQGKAREGVPLQLRILQIREGALGSAHPQTGLARVNYADGLRIVGEYDEAQAQMERALDDLVPVLGDDHPTIASVRSNYALILRHQGKVAESEPVLVAAIEAGEAAHGPNHPLLATYRTNLARTLAMLGRGPEAIEQARRALQIHIEAHGAGHPEVARARSNLASYLEDDGQVEAALAMHAQAAAELEAALGPDHPDVATAHHNIGATHFDAGRCADAVGELEAAWRIRKDQDIAHGDRGDTARLLGTCRAEAGDLDGAREMMHAAADAYDEAGKEYVDARALVTTWLAEHGTVADR